MVVSFFFQKVQLKELISTAIKRTAADKHFTRSALGHSLALSEISTHQSITFVVEWTITQPACLLLLLCSNYHDYLFITSFFFFLFLTLQQHDIITPTRSSCSKAVGCCISANYLLFFSSSLLGCQSVALNVPRLAGARIARIASNQVKSHSKLLLYIYMIITTTGVAQVRGLSRKNSNKLNTHSLKQSFTIWYSVCTEKKKEGTSSE